MKTIFDWILIIAVFVFIFIPLSIVLLGITLAEDHWHHRHV